MAFWRVLGGFRFTLQLVWLRGACLTALGLRRSESSESLEA